MDYYLNLASLILIFIILSQSYNLVFGYTGMIHVGHAAFMAIGAYTSALLAEAGVPFLAGLFAAVAAAGVSGFLLGLPTVRFRDDYLVAATLGMGEIIRLVLLNERKFTHGSDGIPGIKRPEIFGVSLDDNLMLFFFILFITVIVMIFVWRTVHSPFGKVLESIREDEIGSQSLGKNTSHKKLAVLVIAASLAGLAGVLFAHTTQFIDPDSFNIHRMIYIFLIVVLGGTGTFWGPVIGTIIVYTLFEQIRFLPLDARYLGPLRWIIFSTVLIAIIILKPTGIMGKKLLKKKL